MLEAGVLINKDFQAIYWHFPQNRSIAYLPDSLDLWDVIWQNREVVLGFAHSHPGSGSTGPSYEDLSTFAAVELALGRRLDWWITSSDRLFLLRWCGPEKYDYKKFSELHEFPWILKLREFSYKGECYGS